MVKMLSFLVFFTFMCAKSPVLLLPGLSGSQVLYRNGPDEEWQILWLNIIKTLPPLNEQYFIDLSVLYDPETDVYSSTPYETEANSFGSTAGIDHLDNLLKSQTYVYHELIDALQDAGYTDRVDLFGAPFDFRLLSYVNAKEPGGFFDKLKQLIEDIVNSNGEPVVVVSHSEGGAVLRHFLVNHVNESWRSRYFKSWISAAGAFGGAPVAFHYSVSYKQWSIPTVFAEETHNLVQFYTGLYWMLPSLQAFGPDYLLADVVAGDEAFTITVGNLTEGFRRSVGGAQVTAVSNFQAAVNREFTNPNVELFLYYGSGIGTVTSERYVGTSLDDWWRQDGEETKADGDGTVPFESLTAPLSWIPNTTAPIYYVERPGIGHTELISDARFIEDVISLSSKDSEAARGIYAVRRRHVHALHTHYTDLQSELVDKLAALKEWLTSVRAQEATGETRAQLSRLLEEGWKDRIAAALTMEHAIYDRARLALRELLQPLLPELSRTPLADEDVRALLRAGNGGKKEREREEAVSQSRAGIYRQYEKKAAELVAVEREKLDAVHARIVGKEGLLTALQKELGRVLGN